MIRWMLCFLSLVSFAPVFGLDPAGIELIPSRRLTQRIPEARLIRQISDRFDVGSFRQIKAQPISSPSGALDHLLVYLFSKHQHRVDLVRVTLDSKFDFVSVEEGYRPQEGDRADQPFASRPVKCPDERTQFVAFCPNDDQLEIDTTKEVANAAMAKNLKTILLLGSDATGGSYLDYLSCPNLKGNFYDGDTGPDWMAVHDGILGPSDFGTTLKGMWRFQVTNIWVACNAFQPPMLPAVVDDAQAKKYAAGKNGLDIGPADKTGACAMEAALANKPMTQSFQDCYNQFDDDGDIWGFGGKGSDKFWD